MPQVATESAVMMSLLSMELPTESDLQEFCAQVVTLGAKLIPCSAVDLSHSLLGGPRRPAASSNPARRETALQSGGDSDLEQWTFDLSVGPKDYGVLRFLHNDTHPADDAARGLAAAFAVHVTLALDRAALRLQVTHLMTAVDTNREIGAAVGVLMARHGIDYESALRLLRVESQRSNRKLRLVASEVLYIGSLP